MDQVSSIAGHALWCGSRAKLVSEGGTVASIAMKIVADSILLS